LDGSSFDQLTFGHQPHPQRPDYTPGKESVNDFFVTNSTILLQPVRQLSPNAQVDRFLFKFLYYAVFFPTIGQVAQLVERGPEKAGVGGSIPSLATIPTQQLSDCEKALKNFSCVQYA
jgi:hypothetical protein